jgi:hypothetical protein
MHRDADAVTLGSALLVARASSSLPTDKSEMYSVMGGCGAPTRLPQHGPFNCAPPHCAVVRGTSRCPHDAENKTRDEKDKKTCITIARNLS